MTMAKSGVCILGIYVADLAFRADRQPVMGETIMGSAFVMGPGGKGSNQTVATARSGAKVNFISKLGKDDFPMDGSIVLAQRVSARDAAMPAPTASAKSSSDGPPPLERAKRWLRRKG